MQDADGNWIECCIKGCSGKPVALGLCVNHWRRNKKYGSPIAFKQHCGTYQGLSNETRFWMRVKKSDGCWEWTGSRDADGYGVFRASHEGTTYNRAHRFIFAVYHSAPPIGMHVCHKCDNPKCVRVDHLFLGTPKQNMADKIAKGRARVLFGQEASRALLTEDQAAEILNDPRPYAQIAAQYGISPGNVGSIKQRVSWQHLGPDKGVKAKRVSPRKGISDKITPDIVREIRTSAERGIDLAARLGVTKATITDIRKRRSWAHVTD